MFHCQGKVGHFSVSVDSGVIRFSRTGGSRLLQPAISTQAKSTATAPITTNFTGGCIFRI